MGIDRRNFLKLLGVSSTAPLVSCASGPVETIIPYVIQPEDLVPGLASYYATTCRECPAGCGMLIRTREGRAVKAEGNPSHPVNAGALCARGQAALQGLYNPDRIRHPLARDADGSLHAISWPDAQQRLVDKLRALQAQGRLAETAFVAGPLGDSLERLVGQWLAGLGSQRLHIYEPFSDEALDRASQICFQRPAPSYAIDKARFLLGFGADFLETWRSPVAYATAFGKMHNKGRFVQVEPRLSQTGANADTWVSIQAGREALLALGMARLIVDEQPGALSALEVHRLSALLAPYSPERTAELTGVPAWRIQSLARDFASQRPSLALGPGVATRSRQATAAQVAVLLLNYVAGNIGRTVRFEADDGPAQTQPSSSLDDLITAMANGDVPLLLLAHTNPVFSLPRASGFAEALERVPFIVSFSSFVDETTAQADLVLPDHSPLESWGDHSPRPGVHSLMQPVMAPVFDTRPMGDVLLSTAAQLVQASPDQAAPESTEQAPDPAGSGFFTYLQDSWQTIHQRAVHESGAEADFDVFWRAAVQRGGYWQAAQPVTVELSAAVYEQTFAAPELSGPQQAGLPLMLYPSSRYFDGRGANKPWLQELPDPMTKAVWDSWVELHPQTAARLGIQDGEVLVLDSDHGTLEAPAYLYPHMQADLLAMPIGQGHTNYGRYASGRGANPIQLLPADARTEAGGLAWFSTRVRVASAGRREPLVTTAGSHTQLGRGIARSVTPAALAERAAASDSADAHGRHDDHDMYPALEYEHYRWGMTVDLSACTGCGACVTACSAENNIPTVGKAAVAQGREMAWLRIERYFADTSAQHWDPHAPPVSFAPMLCQQCGNAPCEPVCPVYATYHSPEGLNAQIYNRCVGTRYCSNNCSYKVRRFNWSQAEWPEPLHLQLNPDVTVREAGVMEKCTFCVQRIQAAKDRAKDENRPVRDGEVTPACAQTCPTRAIRFGNLEDPDSLVSRQRHDPRAYTVLDHLNTKPAVTYLERVVKRGRG